LTRETFVRQLGPYPSYHTEEHVMSVEQTLKRGPGKGICRVLMCVAACVTASGAVVWIALAQRNPETFH
jgi:hypothetical protein